MINGGEKVLAFRRRFRTRDAAGTSRGLTGYPHLARALGLMPLPTLKGPPPATVLQDFGDHKPQSLSDARCGSMQYCRLCKSGSLLIAKLRAFVRQREYGRLVTRYFFNVRHGDHLFIDPDGEELSGFAAAWEWAVRDARWVVEDVLLEGPFEGSSIEIVDGSDMSVVSLSFADALRKRLVH